MRLKTVIILSLILIWSVLFAYKSSMIVPESELLFSHQFHVEEQEVECLDCHPTIEESSQADDKNLPTMDECETCHDIEDDELCEMCHKNPEEPIEVSNPERSFNFNHSKHLAQDIQCQHCHPNVATTEILTENNFPTKAVCMNCHNGQTSQDGVTAVMDCNLCHSGEIKLADIHPSEWKEQHGPNAASDPNWCLTCHEQNKDCLDCHRGDNLEGNIHELNYKFSHGLDAKSNMFDCDKCHSRENFCNSCHLKLNRMPLNHSFNNWIDVHGQSAREDIENCASCHDSESPTCARVGCHSDFDGIRGTNPPLHSINSGIFGQHGPWHKDDMYNCYKCHVRSNPSQPGFCNYCHTY